MRQVVVDALDPSSIEASVGARTYIRGRALVDRRDVLQMEWDDVESAVVAIVRGGDGSVHRSVAYVEPRRGNRLVYVFGECTCSEGHDCAHTAAAAIMAAGGAGAVGRPAVPSWEHELGALLTTGSTVDGGAVPLAVEISLVLPPTSARPGVYLPEPKLSARLVRPGRTSWVAGSLSWGKLDSATYYFRDCRPQHVRLLQELYALHRSRATDHYRYSGQDKAIDLATVGGRLWPILDEAAEIGLQLVHPRKGLGVVPPYGRAQVELDVTNGAEPESLTIRPVLRARADDRPLDDVPVLFLGPDGHGVVHTARDRQRSANAAEWPLRLSRLDTPAPPALARMALDGRRLDVPAGQQERFRAEFFPRLRHLARVASSDGSFVPPSISDPSLVLQATYGDAHELALRWEWAYDVGDTHVRTPLGAPDGDGDGYRDLAAERALLDGLDAGLDRLGLTADGAPRPATLAGLDTMRFTTEVLPLLDGATGLTVERTGEPAGYREAGDSLRISVSTHDVAGENDWFDLGVDIAVEGRAVPFAQVFAALSAQETHLLLPDGAYFSLDKPELQSLRTLIEEARSLQDTPRGPLRISRFSAGLWAEFAALGVVERQSAAWQQQVAGLLALDGLSGTEVPADLSASLRPYQVDGFGWLAFLWRHRLGGIMADDMGLGKTVQSLALICHAKHAAPEAPPFLIVAPTSVVSNWAAEAARFAPGLTVVTVTDTLRRRGQELAEVIAGADVVVTSYTLFRLDAPAYSAAEWSGLFLDEAQFTKNHQSKVYQCARQLPAPFKLAITGTPMENNLMELWSLLSITSPGLFPSPTRFKDDYARPIEKQRDTERLSRLRRRIRPLMMRRTKEQVVSELPAKQEQLLEVELDPRHRRLYQQHLQRERQKILGLIDDVDRNRFTILRSLTLLRRLSLHPGLVDEDQRDRSSAKIDVLVDELGEVIDGGHKALVFSQFTGFLALVRERLDAAGVPYCYLDGSTRKRGEVVARFTGGAVPVFLISLKAGGVGLNLTEADYCFLLDPWWNPATEAQAVDRAHRIGQTRTVMVRRLIARDTIEEKVVALAARKAELFTGVMDEGGVFGSVLGADDIRALLE